MSIDEPYKDDDYETHAPQPDPEECDQRAHNIQVNDELLLTINNEKLKGKIKEIKKGTFDFTDENGELIYKQSIIIDLEMLPI